MSALLLPLCALTAAVATVLHSSGHHEESTPGICQAMAEVGIHRFNVSAYGLPLALIATVAAGFGQDNMMAAAGSLILGGIAGLGLVGATEEGKVLGPVRFAAKLYLAVMILVRVLGHLGRRMSERHARFPSAPMRHPAMGAVQLPRPAARPRERAAEAAPEGSAPGSEGAGAESKEDDRPAARPRAAAPRRRRLPITPASRGLHSKQA